ncbi:MAG: alpha/beta hydrolase [Nostocoides sp.]
MSATSASSPGTPMAAPSSRPGTQPYAHDGGPVGVLLAHGFTGSPASLRPWAEHLAAAGYTVRLPRLPGHGTTWQQMNQTTWQQWYREIVTAFDELRIRCQHVIVGGLSMGGALVTRLAEERGGEVAGLVLVNPAYLVEDVRMRALPVLQRIIPSLPGIGNDINRAGQDELCYDRIPLKALYSQTKLWDLTIRDMASVTQPVLLLRSEQDHVVPASSSAKLLSRISSVDVTEIVLADSYHVATLDHDADRIFTEADAFIARVVT